MHGRGSRLALLASLALLGLAPSARAAVIPVNSTADSGGAGCELREAVASAEANSSVGSCTAGTGPDTISINAAGTITLLTGELVIGTEVEITGLGAGTSTITQTPVGRILHVAPGGDLGLADVSVVGGVLANDGPGILNEGELTLDRVTVSGNQAVGEDGGGIAGYENSTTTITDSQIGPGNVAGAGGGDGDGHGGGIYLQGGEVTLRRSLVLGNSALENNSNASTLGDGGGIYAAPFAGTPPAVTIESSNIGVIGNGNTAAVNGGGVAIQEGLLTVRASELVDNEAHGDGPGSGDGAGSGVFLIDSAASPRSHEITGSTISRNDGGDPNSQGGGLFSNVADPNSLHVEGTTFFENTAVVGGGALFYGDAIVLNSTFSHNSADNYGAAIVVPDLGGSGSEFDLIHSTLSQNESAAGMGALTPGVDADVFVRASIIEESDDAGACGPFEPTISTGYNVVSDSSCALGATGDLASTSSQLMTLGANGGPSPGAPPGNALGTYGLASGSPAIDRALCLGLTVDQRGFARPSGASCDSGALEFTDPDSDGVDAALDNCPGAANPGQADSDGDGLGDACDPAQIVPSNAFGFGKLKRNKKKGIAFLFVNVPGPGQLGLAGPGLRPLGLGGAAKALAVAGGTVKLRIAPHKKGRKARKLRKRLKRKGKAKVKARVTYVPSGGSANTRVRKLKLVRKWR